MRETSASIGLKRGKRANPAALMHADALAVCDLCFVRDDCACRCPDWLWAPSSVALASGPAARAEQSGPL